MRTSSNLQSFFRKTQPSEKLMIKESMVIVEESMVIRKEGMVVLEQASMATEG